MANVLSRWKGADAGFLLITPKNLPETTQDLQKTPKNEQRTLKKLPKLPIYLQETPPYQPRIARNLQGTVSSQQRIANKMQRFPKYLFRKPAIVMGARPKGHGKAPLKRGNTQSSQRLLASKPLARMLAATGLDPSHGGTNK